MAASDPHLALLLPDLLKQTEDRHHDVFLAKIDSVLGPLPPGEEDPLRALLDPSEASGRVLNGRFDQAPTSSNELMTNESEESTSKQLLKLLDWDSPRMTSRDHSTEAIASLLMETTSTPKTGPNKSSVDELLALVSVQEHELPTPVSMQQTVINNEMADLQLLQHLGSTLLTKADQYIDASTLKAPALSSSSQEGIWQTFPGKLFILLRELEAEGKSDIATFLPHSRAFIVLDRQRFVDEVLPKYFTSPKWSSFTRQLQLYSFRRVSSGVDEGACKFGTRDRSTYRS